MTNEGSTNARPTAVAPTTPCLKYPRAMASCAASGPGMICASAIDGLLEPPHLGAAGRVEEINVPHPLMLLREAPDRLLEPCARVAAGASDVPPAAAPRVDAPAPDAETVTRSARPTRGEGGSA